ncbi:universal stress protein [Oerskovia sp. M15]
MTEESHDGRRRLPVHPEGREALGVAVDEAVSRRSELLVVVSDKDGRSLPEQTDERAEDIARITAPLDAAGVVHRVVTGLGEVAEDLVGTAEAHGAELIVIGLRRRSPVGKLILGSNAQRILLDAPARCSRSSRTEPDGRPAPTDRWGGHAGPAVCDQDHYPRESSASPTR